MYIHLGNKQVVFILFPLWCFVKGIENVLCSYQIIEPLGRPQKSCGNIRLSACVPTAFLILPNFDYVYIKQLDYEFKISIMCDS